MRRSGAAMAFATTLSRLTGLLRVGALAAALGVTSLADAYNIANTVPTILLVLVTGGTLSAVLVPVLAEVDGPDQRRARAESLWALILTVTLAASVLAVLASPLIARLFASGSAGQPGHAEFVDRTTLFLVLFAPQVLAYGLSVHAVAVLNAAGRLALGSFASVATNVITLLATGLYVILRTDGDGPADRDLIVLGAGTTLGVIVMTAIQVWGARRVLPGMRLLRRPRRDAVTDHVLRLGRWTLVYVVANQIGLGAVLTVSASVDGGASAYQWAFAVMQLPFAIVAVSILSAVYPRLSRTAREDPSAFAGTLSRTFGALLVVLLPFVVLMSTLAQPLTGVLLGYGAVDRQGQHLIAAAVAVFGLALLPFSVFQLLTRAYFALGDTKTPALANVCANLVTVTGAGIAAAVPGTSPSRVMLVLVTAYVLSYITGCGLLAVTLRRRNGPAVLSGAVMTMTRMTLPVLITVAVAVGTRQLLPHGQPPGLGSDLLATAVPGALAAGAYLLAVRSFNRLALSVLDMRFSRSPSRAGRMR